MVVGQIGSGFGPSPHIASPNGPDQKFQNRAQSHRPPCLSLDLLNLECFVVPDRAMPCFLQKKMQLTTHDFVVLLGRAFSMPVSGRAFSVPGSVGFSHVGLGRASDGSTHNHLLKQPTKNQLPNIIS